MSANVTSVFMLGDTILKLGGGDDGRLAMVSDSRQVQHIFMQTVTETCAFE